MREFTDEYILYLINKYRDEIVEDLERCLCLDCYNLVKDRNLTEKDVELTDSVCNLCKKEKPCIKK